MGGKMLRYKVKARKDPLFIPCVAELTALLGCFSASSDLRVTEHCAEAAKSLHTCMGKTRIPSKGYGGKKSDSSINYLLNKVSPKPR
ncbi:hypothetical protein BCR39DRAFT_539395 [Naematelia encephala]|uniref:Uncharacterized protein n=1 Tax=Naematelia encephala TaxID=71784 RepID=A0A1Y2AWH7_9TREE|nr:hypothetical protein BCR39DRAFT_539395 [Naematelia encephala]